MTAWPCTKKTPSSSQICKTTSSDRPWPTCKDFWVKLAMRGDTFPFLSFCAPLFLGSFCSFRFAAQNAVLHCSFCCHADVAMVDELSIPNPELVLITELDHLSSPANCACIQCSPHHPCISTLCLIEGLSGYLCFVLCMKLKVLYNSSSDILHCTYSGRQAASLLFHKFKSAS